jgi:hypothetical protein
MKATLFLAAALALVPALGAAQQSVTANDGNSGMTVWRDPDNTYYGYGASDPLQLPRKVDWTVDGRTILVYPSGPWYFMDIGHFHSGGHVTSQQVHAMGPMLGYAVSSTDGTVTGGAVYTVQGGAQGSGVSRLVEKVDIHNKTSGPFTVSLTGLGFKPTQASLPVPDYSGLDVSGTTVVFYQGNSGSYSISDMPTAPATFGPSFVRPMVSFTGFNPLLNESFTIPAGAVLTMITELNVKPHLPTLCELNPLTCRPILIR